MEEISSLHSGIRGVLAREGIPEDRCTHVRTTSLKILEVTGDPGSGAAITHLQRGDDELWIAVTDGKDRAEFRIITDKPTHVGERLRRELPCRAKEVVDSTALAFRLRRSWTRATKPIIDLAAVLFFLVSTVLVYQPVVGITAIALGLLLLALIALGKFAIPIALVLISMGVVQMTVSVIVRWRRGRA